MNPFSSVMNTLSEIQFKKTPRGIHICISLYQNGIGKYAI